jgi:hypothetical protein
VSVWVPVDGAIVWNKCSILGLEAQFCACFPDVLDESVVDYCFYMGCFSSWCEFGDGNVNAVPFECVHHWLVVGEIFVSGLTCVGSCGARRTCTGERRHGTVGCSLIVCLD